MEERPRRKKQRPLVAAALVMILGGMLMLCLFGCGKTAYAVDYRGQKDEYRDARDTYKAGQKVKLTYSLIATDTDYSFWLDGERLNPDYKEGKGFILEFTMPDHDVQLECRAVNSMVETSDDASLTGDLLVDLYTASAATNGGDGYVELTLYAYTSDQLKLVVYRQDDGNAEQSTTYLVPRAAFDRCCAVIDETGMRTWNDSAEPLDGEEGAVTVCKFRDTDGSYVRVTSEAMPEDGAQAFAQIRQVLQSYASDAYRE
jgi:hypothetical protein